MLRGCDVSAGLAGGDTSLSLFLWALALAMISRTFLPDSSGCWIGGEDRTFWEPVSMMIGPMLEELAVLASEIAAAVETMFIEFCIPNGKSNGTVVGEKFVEVTGTLWAGEVDEEWEDSGVDVEGAMRMA